MFALRTLAIAAIMTTSFASSASTFAASHTVATKYGDVMVNNNVQHILALSPAALDISYALEAVPVGTVATNGIDSLPTYLGDQTNGINIVGTLQKIDLNAVKAQHPDLILAPANLPESQYQALSKIAPTIVPTSKTNTTPSWEDKTRTFGAALNKSDEADAVIGSIHDREGDIKNLVEAKLPDTKRDIVLAQWLPQGALLMNSDSFVGSILSAAGFAVVDGSTIKTNNTHAPLSVDELAKLNGDWWFLASQVSKEKADPTQKSPEFTQLNALKKDHVISVNDQVWANSEGPIAAGVVLDDVQKMLDEKVPYPQ